MAKLGRTQVMVAHEMIERGVAVRQVARQLGVTEGALRYRLARAPEEPDGRRDRRTALEGWEDRVTAVLGRFGDARVTPDSTTRCEAREVYDLLVREERFPGSYQAVGRYLRRRFGPPAVQAVRRVEFAAQGGAGPARLVRGSGAGSRASR